MKRSRSLSPKIPPSSKKKSCINKKWIDASTHAAIVLFDVADGTMIGCSHAPSDAYRLRGQTAANREDWIERMKQGWGQQWDLTFEGYSLHAERKWMLADKEPSELERARFSADFDDDGLHVTIPSTTELVLAWIVSPDGGWQYGGVFATREGVNTFSYPLALPIATKGDAVLLRSCGFAMTGLRLESGSIRLRRVHVDTHITVDAAPIVAEDVSEINSRGEREHWDFRVFEGGVPITRFVRMPTYEDEEWHYLRPMSMSMKIDSPLNSNSIGRKCGATVPYSSLLTRLVWGPHSLVYDCCDTHRKEYNPIFSKKDGRTFRECKTSYGTAPRIFLHPTDAHIAVMATFATSPHHWSVRDVFALLDAKLPLAIGELRKNIVEACKKDQHTVRSIHDVFRASAEQLV